MQFQTILQDVYDVYDLDSRMNNMKYLNGTSQTLEKTKTFYKSMRYYYSYSANFKNALENGAYIGVKITSNGHLGRNDDGAALVSTKTIWGTKQIVVDGILYNAGSSANNEQPLFSKIFRFKNWIEQETADGYKPGFLASMFKKK